MGKRLSDNLSSAYIDAANRLNGKRARRKIIAYVEAYDDIFFWRTVLSGFENEERYFEVMLPSRLNLTKGKRSVLMNLVSQNIGENMIACVDADYDYLLQGTTILSLTSKSSLSCTVRVYIPSLSGVSGIIAKVFIDVLPSPTLIEL